MTAKGNPCCLLATKKDVRLFPFTESSKREKFGGYFDVLIADSFAAMVVDLTSLDAITLIGDGASSASPGMF